MTQHQAQAQLDTLCRKTPTPAQLINVITRWQAQRAADDLAEQQAVDNLLERMEETL